MARKNNKKKNRGKNKRKNKNSNKVSNPEISTTTVTNTSNSGLDSSKSNNISVPNQGTNSVPNAAKKTLKTPPLKMPKSSLEDEIKDLIDSDCIDFKNVNITSEKCHKEDDEGEAFQSVFAVKNSESEIDNFSVNSNGDIIQHSNHGEENADIDSVACSLTPTLMNFVTYYDWPSENDDTSSCLIDLPEGAFTLRVSEYKWNNSHKTAFYTVETFDMKGERHIVKRRYSEFRELYSELAQKLTRSRNLTKKKFPPKTFCSTPRTDIHLETRRRGLQSYLEEVMAARDFVENVDGVHTIMLNFLIE